MELNLEINKENHKEDTELLTQLGYALEKGTAFVQDYHSAFLCYSAAAEAGDPLGMNNLGWLYQNGLGVQRDVPHAIELYTCAADAGNAEAMVNLGNIYEFGCDQLEINYGEALRWYAKAGEKGSKKGQFNTANMLHWGRGTKQNKKIAFQIFTELADAGYSSAFFYLGLYYQEGEVVPVDYERARHYYRLGALADDAYCYNQLGVLYGTGLGVRKDIAASMDYYAEAANLGNALANANLAYFYETGEGIDQDLGKAIGLYRIAARAGEDAAIEALEHLGVPIGDEEHQSMRDILYELTNEQIEFIQSEFGLSREDLFSLDEDALYDDVYDKCCDIEVDETCDALDRPNEDLTDRGRIAADIVTLLGNTLAREDDEDDD